MAISRFPRPGMTTSRGFISLSICTLLVACGGGSSSSPAEPPTTTPPASQAGIVLLAENPGGYFFPGGIAVDPAGVVYVGNNARHQVHKVSPSGAVSDFAGSPAMVSGTDGVGDKAGFDYIDQIVYDKRSQSLYAVDRHYQETSGLLRRIGMAGEVSTMTLTSFPSHASEGQVGTANYGDRPASLAVGVDGGLYAATMFSAEPARRRRAAHFLHRLPLPELAHRGNRWQRPSAVFAGNLLQPIRLASG
ncbi:hypothetical protein ACHMW6_30595 [Pseudoduganella sp. UC29_106]|uniref:hypothetical protein n=1 Tax=Pseudoduganella sp. UC29_106 TaxID=3374553 RepID=UPI003757BA42